MDKGLNFHYDREGDILYINTRAPYPEQESEELDDEVVVRLNPKSNEVENIEILFFSSRLLRTNDIDLPLSADITRLIAA
jgi:uncharacterized protein YuzE